MKLTLSVENIDVIRWWVDASYNTHDDCKGQTGGMMLLGKGVPMSISRKQKLNVPSAKLSRRWTSGDGCCTIMDNVDPILH